MLYTIAMILFVCWLFGMFFHVMGNFIHILFMLAIASVLIRVIRGKAA